MTGQVESLQPAAASLMAAGDTFRLLAQLHAAALAPDTWAQVVGLIGPLFGTRKGALISVDTIHPTDSQSSAFGLDPELAERFRNIKLEDDLLFQVMRRLPPGSVVLGSDALTEEQTRTGPLWQDLAEPGRIEYKLIALLENRAEQYTSFALLRSGSDFTAADKDLLRMLLPHLQQVMIVSRRLQHAEAGRREFVRMFDYGRQAMAILDRSGYALFINPIARKVLGEADGMTVKFGRFLFDDVVTQTRFETAVRRALDVMLSTEAALPNEIRVARSSARPALELLVIPVRRPSDRALMPEGAGCLVLINDPSMQQVIAPGRLMRLYGLTAAEAKVCEALLATGAANEVGEMLHITPNTVRSHLKSIFEKMGIGNQAQLMQRLTVLARPSTAADVFGAGIPTAGRDAGSTADFSPTAP